MIKRLLKKRRRMAVGLLEERLSARSLEKLLLIHQTTEVGRGTLNTRGTGAE